MKCLLVILSMAVCLDQMSVTAFAPTKQTSIVNIRPTVSPMNSFTSQKAPMMSSLSMYDGSLDVMTNLATTTDSSFWLSFADQGQNLAGIFFQSSLLPYLAFLYFLSFRGNRVPALGNFGFQFLLLFVLSTIPGGIISKSVYGCSLADVDWLHGGAEALLTATNVMIVLGFRDAMIDKSPEEKIENVAKPRLIALGGFLAFALAAATGPSALGFEAHSPFLFGIGNLPESVVVESLPWVSTLKLI